jgi:hypothetical protein
MDAPARKKLHVDEFLMKVLIELPVPSASEMEQADLLERHLQLDIHLEHEIMALRWWYMTHLLFGQLVHRGRVPLDLSLSLIGQFVGVRDQVMSSLPMDFLVRCEFYERALQDDLDDEGHGFHLLDCFQKFVGQENEALKEVFYASMLGVTARLSKAMDRFEIVAA